MPLVEKLRTLDAIERTFAEPGRTLDTLAAELHRSRASLRDLLHWARFTHEPPLFERTSHGVRGGRLTPEGRALLEKLEKGR